MALRWLAAAAAAGLFVGVVVGGTLLHPGFERSVTSMRVANNAAASASLALENHHVIAVVQNLAAVGAGPAAVGNPKSPTLELRTGGEDEVALLLLAFEEACDALRV